MDQAVDRLFASKAYPRPFAFNEDVACVFDDMVRRSVPFYDEVAKMLLSLAQVYCQEGSRIYDIGCSTGSSLLLLSQNLEQALELIGIDSSEAMIVRARQKLSAAKPQDSIQFHCKSALEHEYKEAALMICNYTLQFISVRERKSLLTKLYSGLKAGGMLFLSEKIRYSDPEMQEAVTGIYEAYKRSKGYSQTEIERKKESLENVLVPVTLNEQISWLKDCGFRSIEVAFKWHCFVSLVAIK
jgi:tRNA (cmo5U34)-methyltransferase